MSNSIKSLAVKAGIGLALCTALAPASNVLATGGSPAAAKASLPPLPAGHTVKKKHRRPKHPPLAENRAQFRDGIRMCM